MKQFHSPILRIGALSAFVAVASGCPSSPAEVTVKPITHSSSTAAAATTKPASTTPGSTNSGSSPDDSNPQTGNGATATPSSSTSTTPGATSSAQASTAATASAGATASVKPSATPSVVGGGSTGGTTPTPTPTPTTDAGGGTGGNSTPTPAPATPTPGPAGNANVSTIAGSASSGSFDAAGSSATFKSPAVLALQGTTALYVGDVVDHRIRRVDLAGGSDNVTTIAGNGSSGYHDGIGQSAIFGTISGMVVDGSGNMYVADSSNRVVRKIDMSDPNNPNVSTIAGTAGIGGASNGTGSIATFGTLGGLCLIGTNLYVADQSNHEIRMIDLSDVNHAVTAVAGSGSSGSSDGAANNATFTTPSGLAADGAGHALFVTDTGTNNIRRVDLTDPANITVSTIAGIGSAGNSNNTTGSSAAFNDPLSDAIGSDGALYVADAGNNSIRRIDLTAGGTFAVTTFAGAGQGFSDGQGSNALFNTPGAIVATGSTLYVSDSGNLRIRMVQ